MENAVIEPEYLLTFSDVEKALINARIDAVRSQDQTRGHITSRLLIALEEIEKNVGYRDKFVRRVQSFLALRKSADWNVPSTDEWKRVLETVDTLRRQASVGNFEKIVQIFVLHIPGGIAVGLDDDELEILKSTLENALTIVKARLPKQSSTD